MGLLSEPGGYFLDTGIIFGTMRPYRNPEVLPYILYIEPEFEWEIVGFLFRSRDCIWTQSSLRNPECLVMQGQYSTFPCKTTTSTCSDLTFSCSEACHYRVPMITNNGMLIWLLVLRADPRLARASACEFCSLEMQYLAACFLIFLASWRSSGRMSFSRYQTRGVIQVTPSSIAETSSDWRSSRVAGH
ncbi:hypothetical protein F2Q70_00011759 [Brassica cretica]|uniref:Uncharacterized protein n=1 Tax=Brassica cretica TaxID=69181 RepID=A0A8S9LWC3_BRACR|nr:hypothetical protein F2Q70_00011759 [Brassica cretica]